VRMGDMYAVTGQAQKKATALECRNYSAITRVAFLLICRRYGRHL